MRKPIIILLFVALCFSLSSCSSTDTTGASTDGQKGDVSSAEEPKVELAEQMAVTDYSCVVDDSFCYYVLFIKNDSEECVTVEANIVAKNETGASIATYSESVQAVAPGQTSCIWTTFDEWDTIKGFDYALSVKKDALDNSIYTDVSIDYDTADTKVIATATNSGSDTATFVWFDVVYLKDGKMVGFSEISLMDDSCQLAAGQSITGEGECYSNTGFDDVAIALNGRK